MIIREVKRVEIKSNCNCSKKEIFLELNFPLDFKDLPYFISLGYKEKKSYTNSGILYLDGSDLIAMGAVGSNKLKIKCKNSKCSESLSKLEVIIQEM